MKRTLWLLLLCASSACATVNTQSYTVTYTCTGGFGPFVFTFPISDPTALTVTMNGTLLIAADYTIVPVNNNYNNGGSVTLGAIFACTTGWPLVLTRVTPATQAIQYYDNMPIPMKTFERGLDKLTELLQERPVETKVIPVVNSLACIKAIGPPITFGYCTAYTSGATCTCN